MRVYLPSTLSALATFFADGGARGPVRAFAVTRALREDGEDDEELEYAALQAAADESLRMLAADPGAPRRRVVIAAEIPGHVVEEDAGEQEDPAAVTVTGTVPVKRVASAHVDEEEAAGDIAAAVADPEAGTAEEHELLWYATQEVRFLVGSDGQG
ncbi:hypothetical protein FHX37_2732 [Haloactinospora alba]|uniref:Uncharacterized protein n=1 Tax=Haloactinospora alba TaxID=405555 RepID=A0A543NLQ3_9ACTN|nr:hypothetical protein [Haloactinospora alba]TQN32750.1 hypothetical protein FHX37_2732 [Haloactinospora alba]